MNRIPSGSKQTVTGLLKELRTGFLSVSITIQGFHLRRNLKFQEVHSFYFPRIGG